MYIIRYAVALVAVLTSLTVAADIRTAYFPPVPDGWDVKIDNTTVIYASSGRNERNEPISQVKFTYSRATHGMDAAALADEFITRNRCSPKVEQGKGFYTSGCKVLGMDVIFIGEVNNCYRIEISGMYTREATALVNKYVNDVVRGKRTFEDRDIGEKVVEKAPVLPPPKADEDD